MKNRKENRELEVKLRNFSQVSSLNRLSDPDSEVSSEIVAGGDEDYLNRDINRDRETKK